MEHPIYRVTSLENLGSYRLRISFDDGSAQEIDFEPILEGELYGPLRNLAVFATVEVDEEAGTIVWSNGADFDPATLHDWPTHQAAMRELAQKWALAGV